jgi:protoporphyrin/coproporphyrin ferrochelatase
VPKNRLAVVLLQLGGPDSLDAVEPFLYNLFCDPDIIDLPLAFLFRRPLARFISSRRGPKVQDIYRRIGKRSPILRLTRRQASALEAELRPLEAKVYVAMRYWHPLTDAVMEQIRNDGCERIVLLPLYPHYSRSTTGSSVNEWNRILRRRGWADMTADVVEQYCDHPSYVAALVRNIGFAIRRVPEQDRGKINLVFSAHGTPMKLVQSGDPYQQQIIRTYEAVIAAGKFGLRHHLCYQSKVGPQRWLEPSLTGTIERLAAEKATHVIAIPIAFVSDHSETLVEINMEAKEQAKHLGIRYFDMSPALNASPLFIDALADLVRKKVGA